MCCVCFAIVYTFHFVQSTSNVTLTWWLCSLCQSVNWVHQVCDACLLQWKDYCFLSLSSSVQLCLAWWLFSTPLMKLEIFVNFDTFQLPRNKWGRLATWCSWCMMSSQFVHQDLVAFCLLWDMLCFLICCWLGETRETIVHCWDALVYSTGEPMVHTPQ